MLPILESVCLRLESIGVDYMLSGSLALNLYTVPRMTRDIDIVLHIASGQTEAFIQCFDEDYFVDSEEIRNEIRRQGMFNLIHKQTALRIDCIVRQDTEYRRTEFGRRKISDVYGFPVWIVAIEDLIISKFVWIQHIQSDKQKEDISHLLANKDMDFDYIRFWMNKLALNHFGLLTL